VFISGVMRVRMMTNIRKCGYHYWTNSLKCQ
jgi:hypothetical protein